MRYRLYSSDKPLDPREEVSGGAKSLNLPEVTPYYFPGQISNATTEDMRTDVETELRSIAKAVELLASFVTQLDRRVAGELKELDERITVGEEKLLSLDTRVTKNEEDIAKLKKDKDSTSARIEALEGDVTSLQGDVTNNSSSIGNVSATVSSQGDKIVDLDNRVTALEKPAL